jgi:hypothetical protein
VSSDTEPRSADWFAGYVRTSKNLLIVYLASRPALNGKETAARRAILNQHGKQTSERRCPPFSPFDQFSLKTFCAFTNRLILYPSRHYKPWYLMAPGLPQMNPILATEPFGADSDLKDRL